MPTAASTASRNINRSVCHSHAPLFNTNKKNKDNHSAPFWFGDEDADHLQAIIKYYTNFLRLNENRPAASREPKQFIGKIKRRPLNNDKGHFITVDDIFVHQYTMRNWGQIMPLVRTLSVTTEWNLLDGLPVSQTRCDENKLQQVKQTPVQPIYSFPLFGCGYLKDTQFVCSHGRGEDWQVGYADDFNQLLQHTMPIQKSEAEHETIHVEEVDEDDDDDYEYESDSDSDEEGDKDDSYLTSDYLTGVVSGSLIFGHDAELSLYEQEHDDDDDYDS